MMQDGVGTFATPSNGNRGEASSDAILAELAAARHRFAGHEIPDADVLLMATRFTK
jgi:hypothetical protein